MTKTGRNDPCPCGSGEKYKRCCLTKDAATPPSQRSGPRGSTVLTNMPSSVPIPHGAGAWPIARVYVPIEDVWRATGLGSVLIERRRSDGLCAWAMFKLDLKDHGLGLIAGKFDETRAGVDEMLEHMRAHMPPFEEGSIELASAYIWGAWAFGEREGFSLPLGTAEPFLALVPKPSGSARSWLAHLVGPGGLTPTRLIEVIASLPSDLVEDETSEIAIATIMRFRVADARAAISLLLASPPDGKGYRFIPGEAPQSDGVACVDFARPLPEGPLSVMPVRGDLQIQGQVLLDGDDILAGAMTLSMAARLMLSLHKGVDRRIELVETAWMGPDEIARRGARTPWAIIRAMAARR